MSSEQNKTIVRRLLEEPWKGNLKVVDELIDRNYVGHDPSLPEPLRGPDGFKENVSNYRAAYSDAELSPVERANINRWDMSFYRERLREKRYAIDQEALRKYFPTAASVSSTPARGTSASGCSVAASMHFQPWRNALCRMNLR